MTENITYPHMRVVKKTTATYFNCQAIENSRLNQDMGGSENGLLFIAH